MNAATDLPFAEVIGDPIYQSKSPVIHNYWLGKAGIAGQYRAVRVRADGLARYLADRRADPHWRGCNVTIPHKQAVLPLLDAPMRRAERVGAANCVYRVRSGLGGDNSDVEGILEAIQVTAHDRGPGVTCLIGAGGAARAAVHALELAGASQLRLIARRPERAEALLGSSTLPARIFRFHDCAEALDGADTVINASPLGMAGQHPMPHALLEALVLASPAALVFDMVYAPLETDLLAMARSLGQQPVDGLAMLIGQADTAFTLFFGAPAPRQHDADLRALLLGPST